MCVCVCVSIQDTKKLVAQAFEEKIWTMMLQKDLNKSSDNCFFGVVSCEYEILKLSLNEEKKCCTLFQLLYVPEIKIIAFIFMQQKDGRNAPS